MRRERVSVLLVENTSILIVGGETMNSFFQRLWPLWKVALAATVILLVGSVALASHNFSDVLTAAFYHNAVEWVFNRGITAGCGGGLYCPDAPVTRGQMAVFLQKEGAALTPGFLTTVDEFSGLDISASTNQCKSSSDYTPTFPQRAFIHTNVSVQATAAGQITYGTRGSFSTNGGVSFADAPNPAWAVFASAPANLFAASSNFAWVDLNPGTPYRFGVRVATFGWPGLTTTADFTCSVVVSILNRNPTTSPLIPLPPTQQLPGTGTGNRP